MFRGRSAILIVSSFGRTFSSFSATHPCQNFITDAISDFTAKKAEEKREKQFEEMLKSMLSEKKWTLRPWKNAMEQQLNSWMMYIPGTSNSKEVKDMKGMKEILDVMTEEELDNPDKINGQSKERISKASGKPVDDVRMLVFMHKQSQVVHKWLNMKNDARETLPSNDWEMSKMMESDLRVKTLARKILHPQGVKSGRGRSR